MSQSSLDIARSLIRFPSLTPDETGAQDYLKGLLQPLGFKVYDLSFKGRDSYPVKNFFARYGTGNNGPHLCFAGHTDVVPTGPEELWSVPPFAGDVVGDSLIGRGSSDMKGNIAAFVAAVEKFLTLHQNFSAGSISLLITGDEEKDAVNGTVRVLEWMAENNHMPDVALVGEPSNPEYMGQEIKIGRRGSLTGKLVVKGKQGHVAYPQRADNPLPRLVQYLDTLNSTIYDKGSAWFPQSNLEITSINVDNTADNVIPGEGRATFNIRFSDRWSGEDLEAKIRSMLDAINPNYQLTCIRGAESFLTQPGEWTYLVSDAVQAITGHKPVPATGGGTSDARFFAKYCPVVECGMINKSIHQVDEFCTIPQLEKCEMIYHEILKRYFI